MEPLDSNTLHAAAPTIAGSPAIVLQVSNRSSVTLCAALGRLLAGCDDVYRALAEQATSNTEQSMFLESLRAVRTHHDDIIACFQRELSASFQALTNPPKAVDAAAEANTSSEELSLVLDPELERAVALSSIVTKTRNESREQLYYLNRRLDVLLENTRVDASNNPLDPAQLCAAFATATDNVALQDKARVVLFKQFERLLLDELPTLYATANQQLVDAGILPGLSLTTKSAHTSKPSAAATADFAHISLLLDNLRDQAAQAEAQAMPMLFSTGSGQAIADQELIDLLSGLQAQVADTVAPIIDIRELLRKMLDQRTSRGEPARLYTPDEDTINLVAMFFDLVLDDQQLPLHTQALIGRLQFPVLKIAVQDKAFFSNSSHPARRLIDEIVHLGIAMSDSEAAAASPVYQRLTTIVRAVNTEQQPSEAMFARALDGIQQIRSAEDDKAAKVEKRTCASVQAEAATKQAQAAVRQILFERLADVSIPQLIQQFLIDEWQQVMFLAHLKYGERSPEEIDVVQTMDDLIWSSLHHVDAKSRHRLQGLLPELQQRLRNWLAQTVASNDLTEQALQPLLALHSQLADPQASTAITRHPLPENQSEALQPSAEQQKSWGEMTALERQHVAHQDLTYSFIKQADAYPVGTWFSINTGTDNQRLRCKLAAKVTADDSYVFVNRLGFKVLALKRKDFAYDLQQQRATVLQTEQFFERTLGKVVGQLQQLAGAVTPSVRQPQT